MTLNSEVFDDRGTARFLCLKASEFLSQQFKEAVLSNFTYRLIYGYEFYNNFISIPCLSHGWGIHLEPSGFCRGKEDKGTYNYLFWHGEKTFFSVFINKTFFLLNKWRSSGHNVCLCRLYSLKFRVFILKLKIFNCNPII